MNVKQEINHYSKEEDKKTLLWLLTKYHWHSQWSFVAYCTFKGKYPNSYRIWSPTREGLILFKELSNKMEKTRSPL